MTAIATVNQASHPISNIKTATVRCFEPRPAISVVANLFRQMAHKRRYNFRSMQAKTKLALNPAQPLQSEAVDFLDKHKNT
jgi:hypothetical protein